MADVKDLLEGKEIQGTYKYGNYYVDVNDKGEVVGEINAAKGAGVVAIQVRLDLGALVKARLGEKVTNFFGKAIDKISELGERFAKKDAEQAQGQEAQG